MGSFISAGLGSFGNDYDPNEAAEDNMALWRKTAFPSAAAVKATRKGTRNQWANMRTGAYQNLWNQSALRGFGSGSGLTMGGAQGIERDYMKGLGNSLLDITKWKHTPMWQPPGNAYYQPEQSTWGKIGEGAGSLFDTALGFFMMNQMMGGGGGGNMGSSTNWAMNPWYQNFRQQEWGY